MKAPLRDSASDLAQSFRGTLAVMLAAVLMASCADDSMPTEPDPSGKDTAASGPYALKNIQVSLADIYAAVTDTTVSSRVDHIDPRPDEVFITSKTDTLSNYLDPVIPWDTCIVSNNRALFIRDVRPDTADYKLDSCEVFQQDGHPYLRLAVKRWKTSSGTNTYDKRQRILMLTLGPLRNLDTLASQQTMVFRADDIRQYASVQYSYEQYSSTSTRIGTYKTRGRTTLDSLQILPTAEIVITLTR